MSTRIITREQVEHMLITNSIISPPLIGLIAAITYRGYLYRDLMKLKYMDLDNLTKNNSITERYRDWLFSYNDRPDELLFKRFTPQVLNYEFKMIQITSELFDIDKLNCHHFRKSWGRYEYFKMIDKDGIDKNVALQKIMVKLKHYYEKDTIKYLELDQE